VFPQFSHHLHRLCSEYNRHHLHANRCHCGEYPGRWSLFLFPWPFVQAGNVQQIQGRNAEKGTGMEGDGDLLALRETP